MLECFRQEVSLIGVFATTLKFALLISVKGFFFSNISFKRSTSPLHGLNHYKISTSRNDEHGRPRQQCPRPHEDSDGYHSPPLRRRLSAIVRVGCPLVIDLTMGN